jgi:hypothetical protein
MLFGLAVCLLSLSLLGHQLKICRMNLSKPFVINNMRQYLGYAKYLVMSPYHLPVDNRICAYIQGFIIAGTHIIFVIFAYLRLIKLIMR